MICFWIISYKKSNINQDLNIHILIAIILYITIVNPCPNISDAKMPFLNFLTHFLSIFKQRKLNQQTNGLTYSYLQFTT